MYGMNALRTVVLVGMFLPLLVACSTDTPMVPTSAETVQPENLLLDPPVGLTSLPGGRTLIVDDDGADCPHAGYNTIQAAVDAADPGTNIRVCAGTYNERVLIQNAAKNGLRLQSHGEPGTVVLDGNNPAFFAGNHAFQLLNVNGVLIEGFTVREYFENIKLTGASNSTIRKNRTTAAGHDGINLANSTGNIIEHNVSFDNLGGNACGVNLVLGSVGNIVRHNVFQNNNWGIRIIAGSTDNHVFSNESRDNRSHGIQNIDIPPGFPPSGGTVIENNRVEQNPIGIEIFTSNATVARNRVFHNTVDLMDNGTNNVFENNHCVTSTPDGLCAHSEGASK